MTSNLPPIAIILITFQRTGYALSTIQAMRQNARYAGDMLWYVADDGSAQGHIDAVLSALDGANVIGQHTGTNSYGASCNRAFTACDTVTPITFWLEDDWALSREFDFTPHVKTLVTRADIGMVRFGYLNVGMAGSAFGEHGRIYWKLDRNVNAPAFTGHPSLRTREFMRAYGPYPEGINPGMTELGFAFQFRQRVGPEIVYPAECAEYGPFGHIGAEKSYTA